MTRTLHQRLLELHLGAATPMPVRRERGPSWKLALIGFLIGVLVRLLWP